MEEIQGALTLRTFPQHLLDLRHNILVSARSSHRAFFRLMPAFTTPDHVIHYLTVWFENLKAAKMMKPWLHGCCDSARFGCCQAEAAGNLASSESLLPTYNWRPVKVQRLG